MYHAKRTDAYFRGELNKFIQVAENHARNEMTQLMHCPCNNCKNLRVFSDPTTIRSHVIVSDFVKVVYLGYKRFFVEGHRYRSKKFYNHFDGRPEFHLLQYNETGTMFSKWFGPSRSFMGRRRKMGGREREIRHLSMVYHSRNSSSSTSTCPIGQILRSAMQSMVCT